VFHLSPDEWTAVLLSLRISIVATVFALPFGIAVAWVLARTQFYGKALLDGIAHLPLVLPPVVTGYLLLISFGRKGLIGAFLEEHFGLVFSFRWTGAALACGVMGFPLMAARSASRSRRSTAGSRTPAQRSAPAVRWCSLPSPCRSPCRA
jgi:molybdate transport system permease protein